MQFRDLGAALVGMTVAYTWHITLRYLMAPSAVLAALLIMGLGLFAVSVAFYVSAVLKTAAAPPENHRRPTPAPEQASASAPRAHRPARPATTARASAPAA